MNKSDLAEPRGSVALGSWSAYRDMAIYTKLTNLFSRPILFCLLLDVLEAFRHSISLTQWGQNCKSKCSLQAVLFSAELKYIPQLCHICFSIYMPNPFFIVNIWQINPSFIPGCDPRSDYNPLIINSASEIRM